MGGREEEGRPTAVVLGRSAKRQRLSGTLNAEGRWESHLVIRGRSALLGTFETQREATVARDQALLMTRGLAAASMTRLPLSSYLDEEGKLVEDAGVREKVQQHLKM